MLTFTCRARQRLEIGEDVEITVEEVAPGEVRLAICAPGRRLTRLDPVPLPAGSGDLRLVHLAGANAGRKEGQGRRIVGRDADGGRSRRPRGDTRESEEHAHA